MRLKNAILDGSMIKKKEFHNMFYSFFLNLQVFRKLGAFIFSFSNAVNYFE